MTKPFLLRVAAQNLSSTVYDSNDLSTIRGSGLALLAVVERLGRELAAATSPPTRVVYAGASELLAVITPDTGFEPDAFETAVRAAINQPLPYRSASGARAALDTALFDFAVAVVEARGETVDVVDYAVAEARIRRRQYCALSVPLPAAEPGARRPCAIDGVRPAVPGTRESRSVQGRRAYGRSQRQAFYRDRLKDSVTPKTRAFLDDNRFTDSLSDLTANRHDSFARALPPALSGKIAIIHLDGNAFGKRRRKLGDDNDAVGAFSDFVSAHQNRMLAALLDFIAGRPDMKAHPTDGRDGPMLRLETLLWGGDEMAFAVPAWAAWDIVELLVKELADWRLPAHAVPRLATDELSLTHGIGLLFANHKTPVRQMRRIAGDDLTGEAKRDRARTRVSCFAFESVVLPQGGMQAVRDALFGAPKADMAIEAGATPSFAEATQRLVALKSVLARSQAMKLALKARELGLVGAAQSPNERATAAAKWIAHSIGEIDRVAGAADATSIKKLLGLEGDPHEAVLRPNADAPALPLMQALDLWEYVSPRFAGIGEPEGEHGRNAMAAA